MNARVARENQIISYYRNAEIYKGGQLIIQLKETFCLLNFLNVVDIFKNDILLRTEPLVWTF